MRKLKSVIVFTSFFISIKWLFAFPLLPEPFKQPHIPKPGPQETAKCKNCKRGERPELDRFCYPVSKVSLFEEKDIPVNELLTINFGEPGPFSPEIRYILHPPGTPGAVKDYLMAEVGRWKVLFRAQMDKIGAVAFFASNLPGYAIRREGDNLVLTNYNTLQEFSFASLDAGQTWKLIALRRLNQPNSTIKCEYDNEGYMTRLTLPGGRIYKIEYKYGQVQKVTSPNGAITNFYWNEIGFLARVKTVLGENHPFYRKPKKKRWGFKQKKVKLPVVRDIYIDSTMDGHLSSLTTSSGERYTAEYMLDRNKYRQITTGILTHPNGRRDYRINKTVKGRRAADIGVVEKRDGKDVFLPYRKVRYASSNGSLYIISTDGTKTKRAPGTLAIVEQTDAMGNTTKYKYNKLWQRTKTINPDGGVDQKVYDDYGRKIKEIDECNRPKTFKRNKDGLLLEHKAGNVKTKYEYNSEGYPVKTITPDGLCHKFSWDKFGRMTSHTKPDGTVVQYEYYGTLDYLAKLTITSADQKKNDYQKYSYDAQGRLTKIDYPDNTYEEFTYNCCNVIAKRSRSGRIIRYAYDSNQKLTKIFDDRKVYYQAEYDIYGKLLKRTYSNGKWTARKYGEDQHATGLKNSDGKISKYYRNAAGWADKMVTNKGTEAHFKYNGKRKITSIRGTEYPCKDYVYDKSGNITSETLYANHKNLRAGGAMTIKHVFDDLNREIKTVYPDGRTLQKVYKEGSEQLEYINLDGVHIFYTYNKIGQVKSLSVVSASELKHALTRMERKALIASKVSEIMEYDQLGRLDKKYDKNKRLLAKYLYYGNTNKIKYIVEPVSAEYGAAYRYRRGRKRFVRYVNLKKTI